MVALVSIVAPALRAGTVYRSAAKSLHHSLCVPKLPIAINLDFGMVCRNGALVGFRFAVQASYWRIQNLEVS